MTAQQVCLSNSRCTEGLLQRLEALNQNANEHQRANVTIVYSSIDGLTSNPLSWCYLRNRFPNITFTLGIRLPEDDNHSVIRSFAFAHSDRHNAIRWAVYSVDVLSCLYPPSGRECSHSLTLFAHTPITWLLSLATVTRLMPTNSSLRFN